MTSSSGPAIEYSSRLGDAVFDPFVGSGTTISLIGRLLWSASQRRNRR